MHTQNQVALNAHVNCLFFLDPLRMSKCVLQANWRYCAQPSFFEGKFYVWITLCPQLKLKEWAGCREDREGTAEGGGGGRVRERVSWCLEFHWYLRPKVAFLLVTVCFVFPIKVKILTGPFWHSTFLFGGKQIEMLTGSVLSKAKAQHCWKVTFRVLE